MFDGEPSSADLAARFGVPVVVVMDVKGMAQTAAAIVNGLAEFRDDVDVVGIDRQQVRHRAPPPADRGRAAASIPLLASLARSEEIALPERHLGLVQAAEVADELELRFEAGADWLEQGRRGEYPRSISSRSNLPLSPARAAAVAIARASASVWRAMPHSVSSTNPTCSCCATSAPKSSSFRRSTTRACPRSIRSGFRADTPNCTAKRLAANHALLAESTRIPRPPQTDPGRVRWFAVLPRNPDRPRR